MTGWIIYLFSNNKKGIRCCGEKNSCCIANIKIDLCENSRCKIIFDTAGKREQENLIELWRHKTITSNKDNEINVVQIHVVMHIILLLRKKQAKFCHYLFPFRQFSSQDDKNSQHQKPSLSEKKKWIHDPSSE